MESLLKRLSEPSTWAALGALALVLGLSQETFDQGGVWVTGGAAFLAFVIGEAGKGLGNLLDRLKEPSSWAGAAPLLIALGFTVDQFTMWFNAAAGVVATVAVIAGEGET